VHDVFVLHGAYAAERPFGCTYIRLLRPLTHPSVSEALRLTHGTRLPEDHDPSVVVVERLANWPPERSLAEAEHVVHELERRRIPFVYTTDDNLLDLHRDRPWALRSPGEIRAAVRLLARRAAGVVVATEALRERMRALNPRTVTVPNALDERLFGPPGEPNGGEKPLVVGYMGTRTHEADFRMVLRPLQEFLTERRGEVRLEVIGIGEAGHLEMYLEGPDVSRLEPWADETYPRFPGWMRRTLRWDFAIAPLADDPFTRCKSDLKYLDYGALAIPGIFSDVRPYRETVRHRETGLLVANEPDAWSAALQEMASDAALRSRLACAARDEVHATRMLATNATRWIAVLDSIRASSRAS
jgi:glycosyltransferase involved in cell wall biosynthesis